VKNDAIMGVDLYAIEASPPCRAVFLVAKAIGVDLNIKPVNLFTGEHMKPWFLKINPQHTVPAMDDNGLILTESRAICTYLMNKYAPTNRLYPRDPAARGLVDARLYYDADLATAHRGIIRPLLFDKNLKASQDGHAKFHENLQVLEWFLGQSAYVAGDQLTIADLSVITYVSGIEAYGFDFSAYPKVMAWMAKLKALPYYEVNDKGAKMLGGAALKAKQEVEGKK